MRTHLTAAVLLAVLAAAGLAGAANDPNAPSCSELSAERSARGVELKRLTAAVEQKNQELGETTGALVAARGEGRRKELERRREGLRRELTVLLDREHEHADRVGMLDSMISKGCSKRGGK